MRPVAVYMVVALQCEATPIIEKYKLKPEASGPYKLYSSDNIYLIISGMGRINAAAATAALLQGREQLHRSICLNIGVAGHQCFSVNSVLIANKIIDESLNKKWNLPSTLISSCKASTVVTVDQASENYPENSALDMEAAGFYPIASMYMLAEMVHVFKVVSDNPEKPLTNINKQKISDWIRQNISMLDELIQHQSELVSLAYHDDAITTWLSMCESTMRINDHQKNKLFILLMRYKIIFGELPVYKELEDSINEMKKNLTAESLINCLKRRINNTT